MKVALSGSHGFIGSALKPFLEKEGHEVISLIREPKSGKATGITWNPETGHVDTNGLNGVDAVIHLAGENIFGPWTKKKKEQIRSSRVRGTRFLCEALAAMPQKPKHFLCAGAIGYYGTRGNEELTEDSLPGSGFLAEVCKSWERMTQPAKDAGIRVVNMRFGIVLDPSGGALKTMLVPFRMGLGGVIGDGSQFFNWVTRIDLCRAISFLLSHPEINGPVNIVAPEAITNKELTQTLGQVLHRPTGFRVSKGLLRTVLGDFANEMLLSSARVRSKKLEAAGFEFESRTFKEALEHLILLKKASSKEPISYKKAG